MKEVTAKNLFEIFCEKFAEVNDGTKSFPTTLIIEFLYGTEIVFYPEESEWFKMSFSSIEDYYSDYDMGSNYAYEISAIIINYKYSENSIDFENLRNQFDQIQDHTGFSHTNSIAVDEAGIDHVIALTHFEHLTLQRPEDYENMIFNHTLSTLSNSYNQYQKPIFSEFRLNKKIHTFTLRWWESNIGYSLHFDDDTKVNFDQVLYAENDVELMLEHTHGDQEAFFSIWLILYRICVKLKSALADHPMFLPNFECYPTFFDHFQQNEVYGLFAEKHKDLDINEYVNLLLKTLKKPQNF
ncbi:hypothetical protein [Flavivirga algicola]|uniref:Uncharacterized protein n=1 Tax=Flavivirga algicola TaxID=2729136 RepID=A0ABX1RYR7_9FLAO|nr:hypothetical protein [Flavivirga algicola]NMH87943.1 hypothetical protein [Flavivirga algicola]